MGETRDEAEHDEAGAAVEEESGAEGATLVESETARLEAKVQELEARLRTVSAAYRQKQD